MSLVVAFLWPITPAFAAEADLSWTGLSQEYDGQEKNPVVTTEPPNLDVTLEYFPRSNSEVLFQRVPEIGQPSYPSYGLNGKVDIGLGDLVDLQIDNQRLESVDVVMVNFAQATSWPQLAEENSEGYLHPLTLTIYRVLGDDLFLVTEKTQDFFIPWRPATLDDGGEYPFGGRAFRARFNFTEEQFLAGNLALVISYNTNQGGPAPLGVAGPYDSLNVALNDDTPLVGSDDNPSRVIRQTATSIFQSGAFGTRAPMFVVRGFPASPATGQPIEAGGYLVRATVDDGDFTAEAYENFEITPQEVELELLGVRQVADGSPKTIEVAEIPEGSSVEVVFAKRDDLPVEEGLYPFFVRLSGGNFSGSRSGVMRLVADEDTSPLVITSISTAATGDVSLTWNSRAGQAYAILAKDDLNESDISLWDELDGSIESQGSSTTAVISSEVVHSITDIGKIFFRVRKQR
ncbi:MBG domain-containing protein [Akkermansiaceae bacterium]|nr:MBG domain-containing protein [Akkermansiaceae bacterium]